MGKLKIKVQPEIDPISGEPNSITEIWKEINDLEISATPSSNNSVINKAYLDKRIQESGGVFVAEGSSTYTPPVENQAKLWIDTNPTTGGLKYYNGSSWVYVPVAFS